MLANYERYLDNGGIISLPDSKEKTTSKSRSKFSRKKTITQQKEANLIPGCHERSAVTQDVTVSASHGLHPPKELTKELQVNRDGTLSLHLPPRQQVNSWHAQQRNIGIESAEIYRKVIRTFANESILPEQLSVGVTKTSKYPIEIGKRLVLAIKNQWRHHCLGLVIFNFLMLLFYFYCFLFEKHGISFEKIENVCKEAPIPV